MQLSPDRLPDALTLKLAKNVVDGRARRKSIARKIAPGTAGAQQIENGVHCGPHVGLARSPAGSGRWNQRLEPRPLRISEIARIAGAVPPINPTMLQAAGCFNYDACGISGAWKSQIRSVTKNRSGGH